MRQLRDQWQSGNTSLFEALDASRSDALSLQNEVEDDLLDLREANGDGAADEVSAEFSEAFEKIMEDWGKFHEEYTALRDDLDNRTTGEISAQLSALVDLLSGVAKAIDELPTGDATDSTVADLKEAVDAENEPLVELTDVYQALPGDPEDPTTNGEVDPALFDLVDTAVEKGAKTLKNAQKDLETNGDPVSPEELEALDEFQTASEALIKNWDSFHEDYDTWQRNGRGCDETAAAQSLGEFAVQASDLTDQVRGLPQADALATIGDALIDAAEREEEAFRDLRNNWRPFGSDVYRGIDQERNNAQQLRRQADQGLQQLMDRFGLSSQ